MYGVNSQGILLLKTPVMLGPFQPLEEAAGNVAVRTMCTLDLEGEDIEERQSSPWSSSYSHLLVRALAVCSSGERLSTSTIVLQKP